MIILKAILTSILSMILLFFMTKLTGDKQISQMSAFDYITGITIGSSAAEMAIGGDAFLPAAVATFLYGAVAFLISFICNKSIKARYYLNGQPIILYRNGVFYKKNMAKVRLDMGELLTQCRMNGVFSLQEVECIIMESNGRVSFLNKNCGELGINVMTDGRILSQNLESIGKNDWWLLKKLDERKLRVKDVMLATVEGDKLCIYPSSQKEEKNTLFE